MLSENESLDNIIKSMLRKLDRRAKIVFLSSIICGILTHGMALFNKYSFHDDAGDLFRVGSTVSSGRWMLGVLYKAYLVVFGDSHYSLPLLNGVISILCIAVSAYLIIRLLDIRLTGHCIALTGLLISFPTITGLFGYMFTAPYYMFSLLLAVVSAYILCRKQSVLNFLVSILLFACSIGIYQAFISVMLCLVLFYYISRLTTATTNNRKSHVVFGLYLIGAVAVGVILYFVLNQFFLSLTHKGLSSYKGIDTMGKEAISVYFARIVKVYLQVLWSPQKALYPFRLQYFYYLFYLMFGIFSIILFVRMVRKNAFSGILFLVCTLLVPLAANFVYVMCDPGEVHQLMLYGHVMLFVYLAYLFEKCGFPKIRFQRAVHGLGYLLLLLIVCFYCRFANIVYLKQEFNQQRAISYFTTMITQIKSTDGYRDELPVVYINPQEMHDSTVQELVFFLNVYNMPDSGIESILRGSIIRLHFINNWCAFNPEYGDAEDFENLPEVIEMPCYPDDGSIRIINDTVVVKFGPASDE